MLTFSAILFGIAALGGIVLAVIKERPMFLSIIHGMIAAVALILLIIGVFQGGAGSLPAIALILFVIAALGGFVMFASHLRGRQISGALPYIHGFVAAIAEVLLIAAVV